jgi:hypothetical protein
LQKLPVPKLNLSSRSRITDDRLTEMTICIGAIADGRKKAIFAADRMVTSTQLSVEFEHDEVKYETLSPKCVALTAGEVLAPTEFFRTARAGIRDAPKISEIVHHVEEGFLGFRTKRVEDTLFKPRGLTIQGFLQAQRAMNPDLVLRLDRAIETAKVNTLILIVGVDPDGAHIYQVIDPGHAECFDKLGFHAIGSGLPHAISTFISHNYAPHLSLKKAIYIVYEAKKNAEKAPGVGSETDIGIVDDSGIRIITDEEKKLLDEIHQKRKQAIGSYGAEIESMIDKLPM